MLLVVAVRLSASVSNSGIGFGFSNRISAACALNAFIFICCLRMQHAISITTGHLFRGGGRHKCLKYHFEGHCLAQRKRLLSRSFVYIPAETCILQGSSIEDCPSVSIEKSREEFQTCISRQVALTRETFHASLSGLTVYNSSCKCMASYLH